MDEARYQGRPCKRGHSGVRYKAAQLLSAEVDHRTPLAMGGAHCLKNLQILSPAAHRAKTARDQHHIREWRKAYGRV